jgi:RNA polymerase sigma-32 factor
MTGSLALASAPVASLAASSLTASKLSASPLRFPTSLPALGNLDAYISTVNRLPMLTPEQELDLATRLQANNDLEAARIMVMSHLRLVVSIARQYVGYGLNQADLIQEGNIGLMKAVKRFDHTRGVRLVSFAMHWIKAEMHEYIIKNWRMVKVATTKPQRKLFFNLRSHKIDGKTLTPAAVDALAKELNVKPAEVIEMEMRLGGGDTSLENSGDDDDESYAPIAYLQSPHSEPSQMMAAREADWLQSDGIGEALDSLDERSRDIVASRWLQDDDDKAPTLHDLAAKYKVSAERIRQIEVKALQKMKGVLAQYV